MSDPSATVMLWTLLLSVGLAGCAVPPAPRTEEVVVTRPAVTPSAADAAPPDRSRAHDDRALGLVAPVAVHPRSKAERISVVVNRHLREIQACYERELLTNPNLEGKVVLQWVVAETGRVTKEEIMSSTMPGEKVPSCMRSAVRRWVFAPSKEQPLTVVHPFVFGQVPP